MSPRAACRLDGLGLTRVYDYVDGLADWKAAGLPTEGRANDVNRVADATRGDIPTGQPGETIGEIRPRLTSDGWQLGVVVECDGVVVGRLREQALEEGDDRLIEEVMEPGPSTVRPDGLLEPLVERMEQRNAPHVVVTTAQGHLIGILIRDEGRRLLAGETPTQIWRECDGCPGRWADTA